jgi:predicted nucleic acid-binding protein
MGIRRTVIELLILDACVLIDLVEVDETVLSALVRHLGPVYIAAQVLAEVDNLDEARAIELGVQVVEPSLELLARASAGRARLSFQDHICLLLAAERGWACVTNDRALRRVCESEGVAVYWGLQIIAQLVHAGGLPVDAAIELAEQIGVVNPSITREILERFRASLGR